MTSCLVDNCRWLYLRNLLPFYFDLWPRPCPGQWGCLTVNRSSIGSQYIPANGGPPGCCHHQHECSHQKNFPYDVRIVQVILFEIDCSIFCTNLHELFCQFISWTNWVNTGEFMDNCWIPCQVMADVKKVYNDLIIINL